MPTNGPRDAIPSTATPLARQPGDRRAWMDNLRVAIIAGVIVAHTATAYILDFPWYYEERTASVVAEAVVGTVVAAGLLFGMGLLFLLAGLLTPPAFVRKGAPRFTRDRLVRLGVPLLLYVFVIDALTDFIGYRATVGNRGLVPYLEIWWRNDADLGPAWFVAVLLVFSLGYAAWRSLRPARRPDDGASLGGRQLLLVGLVIVAGSFVIRLAWPFGSRAMFGLNLWELPQMVALFGLGVLSAERNWLEGGLPDRLWRRCGAAAILGALSVPLVLALLTGRDDDPLLGGLDPRALLIPIGEAVIAIGMSLWTLEWFRRRWNGTGPVRQGLGRASFAAYLVHPPVIVLLSVALQSVAVPAEVKFLVVSAVGVVGAFALGWLLTRWRPVARIV